MKQTLVRAFGQIENVYDVYFSGLQVVQQQQHWSYRFMPENDNINVDFRRDLYFHAHLG